MGIKYITIDVFKNDTWIKFTNSILTKYPRNINTPQEIRYHIDQELKSYKAIWATDYQTYSKLMFESENHKTLFFMRWS